MKVIIKNEISNTPLPLKIMNKKAQFTVREFEILKLIVDGNTSKSISEILGININTVEAHRKSILKKTGARRMTEVVGWLVKKKIL